MQEKPQYITIAGEQVPIWCDLFVINEIQEKYGLVSVFERKLIGLPEDAGAGKVTEMGEPSVDAILFALPLMIREGYKKAESIENTGCATSHKTKEDIEKILLNADVPFMKLAEAMHEAYRRCFYTKK